MTPEIEIELLKFLRAGTEFFAMKTGAGVQMQLPLAEVTPLPALVKPKSKAGRPSKKSAAAVDPLPAPEPVVTSGIPTIEDLPEGAPAITASGVTYARADTPEKPQPPAPPVAEGEVVYEKVVKPLTPEESYPQALLAARDYVQRYQKSTPDGMTRLRTIMASIFKVTKVAELSHEARVEFIAYLAKEMAEGAK